MTARLDEMTWPEVKDFLRRKHVMIVPVGSTEQHGTHLPLNVDSMQATYLTEKAALKVNEARTDVCVLVAPTFHYGDVSCHKMFPGTIGVSVDTLIRSIEDISRNMLDQGFNNLVFYTAHSQNNCSIEAALRKVNDDIPQARLFAIFGARLGRKVRESVNSGGASTSGHGLESETAQALVMQPQNVKMDKATKGSRALPLTADHIGDTGQDKARGITYYSPALLRGYEASGLHGDPTQATVKEGEDIIKATVDELADILLQILNLS